MFFPIEGKYSSRRRVLLTYMITYLIIITLLFIVIGSFSYSSIIRAKQEKVQIEMEQGVNKVVSVMNTNLRYVLNLQSSFYTNSDVSRLRKLKTGFEPKEFMRFLDMSNKLSSYTSSGQFLDRLTLYFHYNHLFIASNMLSSRPEVFYKLQFQNERIKYSQWRNEQMKQTSRVFYVTDDSTDGYVDLYYRLPILDDAKGVTVLARIKVGELINNLGLTKLYNDSALILTDGDGKILYSNREEARTMIQLAASSPDNSTIKLGDNSYEWCSDNLSPIDWTISFFVSTKDIYADSRRTEINLIGLYSLMLVSSLILSVIFSKGISDPVVSLLGLVDGMDGVSTFTGNTKKTMKESFFTRNLYYVLRRVSDMSKEYVQLASRINEYKDISRELFYNRLLKGEVISADEIKIIEEDSILGFNYYIAAVARIISCDSKLIDIAMFAASETFSGMRESGICFCKTAFDRFAIIICRNKSPDQSEITDVIESFFNKTYNNSPISLRWGVGDIVTNFDQIFDSYRNAEYALYNMDVFDSEIIVWYSSTDRQKNRLTYNFDNAQRFYTLICNGDSETTIQAIKELVNKNKEVLEASRVQRSRFISMFRKPYCCQYQNSSIWTAKWKER